MFKKIKYIFSKTRVAFLGLLLILLPFIFLSYSSYTSLTDKSDSQKNAFQITANLIAENIEREIKTREERLANISKLLLPSSSKINFMQVLKKLELENPFIHDPFIIRQDGSFISGFITLGLEKEKTDLMEVSDSLWTEFKSAEEAEFIKKNYKEAIKLYRNSLREKNIAGDSILVLSRIARCFYKSNDFISGIKTYEQIAGSGNSSLLLGSIPSDIAALIQISEGHEHLGDPLKRCNTLIEIYRKLIQNPFEPFNGLYRELLKSSHSGIQNCLPNISHSRQNEIRQLEQTQTRLFQQAGLFTDWKTTLIKNIRLQPSLADQIKHLDMFLDDSTVKVGIFNFHNGYFGYILNEMELISEIMPGVLAKIGSEKNIKAALLDKSNNVLYGSINSVQKPLAHKEIRDVLSGCKIVLFDKEGRSISELADKERRQAGLLFGGTIFIMLLGVFLIVRSALRELEISRMKSDFVSNVSHELKTPLSLIRMFGETLESGLVTDDKQRKEFYSIINRESDRLTNLINNVLDFSRFEENRKEFVFKRVNLSEVLINLIEPYKRKLCEKGFNVNINIPSVDVCVLVDAEAIQRAIINLISNAEKYSDRNKFIGIELRKEAHKAAIIITDHGIGIPSAELRKVFDKFYRSRNSFSLAASGTGLGLTITKSIVEKHNGTIEVESETGKGSKFVIYLPLTIT